MLTTFVYSMVALFCGGLTGITIICGGDHDFGHDVGHDGSHDGGWLSWLSVKVISAFGTGFGAAGAIAKVNGLSANWSLAIAIASGLVIAVIIKILLGFLTRQECSGSFSRDQLVGKDGTVIMGILEGEIGEVQFVMNGQLVNFPSKSEDGKPIEQGSRVAVVAIGSVLLVKRV